MGKSIELLKNIINNNREFRPTLIDKRWKKVQDKGYYIMPSTKYYLITDKLIKIMEKYSKIYKGIKSSKKDDVIVKEDDGIAIIYLLEEDITEKKYIGYTMNPLFTLIKLNMHKHNINQDNIFENFEDSNLSNFSFEIIEYVKFNDRKDVLERKRFYQDKFINKIRKKSDEDSNNKDNKDNKDKKNRKEQENLKKIYEKRMDIFFEILGKQVNKFKSFTGFIYLITNILNNKKFVGGYYKKLTKKNLFNLLKNNDNLLELLRDIRKYGRRNFEFIIIDKYDAKTTFDFLIRIDFFKLMYDTIEKGYNKGFSLDESKNLFSRRLLTRKKRITARNIFLKIQKYLFEKNFKDPNSYDDIYGYVYQIQHKKTKMRYFAYTHLNKLKNIIIGLYNSALKGNVKHSKILKAFEEETYDSFTYKILKKKKVDDHKMSLEEEVNDLIFKYDTINKGYNINIKKLRRNIAQSKKNTK